MCSDNVPVESMELYNRPRKKNAGYRNCIQSKRLCWLHLRLLFTITVICAEKQVNRLASPLVSDSILSRLVHSYNTSNWIWLSNNGNNTLVSCLFLLIVGNIVQNGIGIFPVPLHSLSSSSFLKHHKINSEPVQTIGAKIKRQFLPYQNRASPLGREKSDKQQHYDFKYIISV